jgi:hypothetical protein
MNEYVTPTNDIIAIGVLLASVADALDRVKLSSNVSLEERRTSLDAVIDELDNLHNHVSGLCNKLSAVIDEEKAK